MSTDNYRVLGCRVRGRSHVREHTRNQDALHWLPRSGVGPPLFVAVSDGHGSAKYMRSHRGACLAVRETTHELRRFWRQTNNPSPGWKRSLEVASEGNQPLDLSAIKRLAQEWLPRNLVQRWVRAVNEDLGSNPFTQAELTTLKLKAGDKDYEEVLQNPLLAYGATLLATLYTADYMLLLQLGDGDIMEISSSGEAHLPMPSDQRLLANETTSLCGISPWRDFRVVFQAIVDRAPDLVMMSTDGYANSFSSADGFLQVGLDIRQALKKRGLESVQSDLRYWLRSASYRGSGDDIALSVICRSDLADPQSQYFARMSTHVQEA